MAVERQSEMRAWSPIGVVLMAVVSSLCQARSAAPKAASKRSHQMTTDA